MQARRALSPGGAAESSPTQSIKEMPQAKLFEAYAHEAGVHRDLMMNGAPIPPAWKHFRQFMLDVGPCPGGAGWVLALKDGAVPAYDAQSAYWTQASDPEAVYWVKGEGVSPGEWNKTPRIGGPGAAPQDAQADLSQIISWLPEAAEKREAFHRAFQMWRRLVKPAYVKSATPTFLFLYVTVAVLKDLRDRLDAEGLMDTHTARNDARDQHPAWGQYCEQMGRAQATLALLPDFSTYSLITELDKLHHRLIRTEQKFRA